MSVAIERGQVWRHKRDHYRRLTITGIAADDDYVAVTRNTSRRRQAVLVTTLRRHYELVR